MIQFGLPLLLITLTAAPALALLLSWGLRRRRAAEQRFAGSGLELLRSGRIVPGRRRIKAALLLLVAGLLAFSIARPQLGQSNVVLPREGSDVVLALDVSRSMGVTDVRPSRLDRAKAGADTLIDHLGGDRVGLIVFAGSANVRFPLTTDTSAAREVIDGLAIGDSGVKPGTDIAGALASARGVFTGDKTRGKVIVLFSDGEDLGGDDLGAAREAANAGLIVHTVGVGTAAGGEVFAVNPRSGQATPVIDPATGRTAVSHRDDDNLRRLAGSGQGATHDGNTTDFAFDLSGGIGRLEKTRFASGATTTPTERFQIPLALALLLLVADALIADTARRPKATRVQPSVLRAAPAHPDTRVLRETTSNRS